MPRFTHALRALLLCQVGCATTRAAVATDAPRFCTPTLSCWPSPADWQGLRSSLTGRLEQAPSPLQSCVRDAASPVCQTAIASLKNPFGLQDQAGATQSLGWMGAWQAATSAYAVVAKTPADIVAAVNFAREHRLRLAIKGTGHDYLGRSNAPDSLLVWTHEMRRVEVSDSFVPQGCGPAQAGVPAVTVEAGTRWIEAYDAVTVEHHRYVQGGGCTSVGAAGGFMQGGGFGSWSKKFGIAAAGMLEAQVVIAGGELLTANACQNQDLFWALRGGGGGTFGVVTKVTLMTHPLPNYFGSVFGTIQAKSDDAFKDLLRHFLELYDSRLGNEHWGEQVKVGRDDSLKVSLNFEGLSADDAKRVWAPFRSWVEAHPESFSIQLGTAAWPGEKMWDPVLFASVPGVIVKDQRPGEPGDRFWWAGDGEQVATYWYTYQSRWIPLAKMRDPAFADVLFEASRHWSVSLHFNKGQAGAAPEALQRDRQTSMNPAVYDAAALAILAADVSAYPGVQGHEPDRVEGQAEKARVTAAMNILREATPGAGSYVNETDYFEPDWQHAFWGENYARLLAIKHKYDPQGLFLCHHCVGSEALERQP